MGTRTSFGVVGLPSALISDCYPAQSTVRRPSRRHFKCRAHAKPSCRFGFCRRLLGRSCHPVLHTAIFNFTWPSGSKTSRPLGAKKSRAALEACWTITVADKAAQMLMPRQCIHVVSTMGQTTADPHTISLNPGEAPTRDTRPQKSFKDPMAICGSNQTPTLTPIYSIYPTIHVGPGCHKGLNGAQRYQMKALWRMSPPAHTFLCAWGVGVLWIMCPLGLCYAMSKKNVGS